MHNKISRTMNSGNSFNICFWMHVTFLPYLNCDVWLFQTHPAQWETYCVLRDDWLSLSVITQFPICRVWICYIVMDDVNQTTISICSQQTLLMIRTSCTDLSNSIVSFCQVMTHNTISDIFVAKHFSLIHEQNAQWPNSGWLCVL